MLSWRAAFALNEGRCLFMFMHGEPPVQGIPLHSDILMRAGMAPSKAISDATDRWSVMSSCWVQRMTKQPLENCVAFPKVLSARVQCSMSTRSMPDQDFGKVVNRGSSMHVTSHLLLDTALGRKAVSPVLPNPRDPRVVLGRSRTFSAENLSIARQPTGRCDHRHGR